MTTNDPRQTDSDWAVLVADWHAGPPPGHSLDATIAAMRRRVVVHRRAMMWVVGSEIGVTLATLAGTVQALRLRPGPQAWLVAADSWLLLVVIWGFVLWNRRGTWRPLTDTTEAFIALARLRCARQLRTVWLVVGVVAAQVAVGLAMTFSPGWGHRVPLETRFGLAGWRVAALIVVCGYLACAAWFRQHTLRELARLDKLHEQMRLSSTDG